MSPLGCGDCRGQKNKCQIEKMVEWLDEWREERQMIPEETIQEAVRRLVEAAKPRKVILFGSYARGDARARSDLDFMVVEREVKDTHREMVRLDDALRSLRIPVDVLVVSEAAFDYWSDTTNTVMYEAKHKGKVCYEEKERAGELVVA